MKFSCSKSSLAKAVSISSRAVPLRSTKEILDFILIEATKGNIRLIANNMELGIETTIAGLVEEEGSIALNARLFSEIVRKLPENDVSIETNEKMTATLRCEKAVFSLAGRGGDEISLLPSVEKEKSFSISQLSFEEMIRQTIFSVAEHDTNKMMTGELFEINENILKVVSLDGHRVSIRKRALKENYEKHRMVIPGKTLLEISRIISGESDEDIMVYYTENHVLFEFNQTKVVSRLINGEYFKIEQMISKDYDTKIQMNRKDISECMERALLLIRDGEKKPVVMKITDGKVSIGIRTALGSMNEEIEAEKQGNDLKIAFNPKFILDVLKVVEEENIEMYMTGARAPGFIRDEGENYTYLILPINFVE